VLLGPLLGSRFDSPILGRVDSNRSGVNLLDQLLGLLLFSVIQERFRQVELAPQIVRMLLNTSAQDLD
jgi:hypothetical protein